MMQRQDERQFCNLSMHLIHLNFSVGLEWHIKICISKLQGDVAGLGTTLRIPSTIQLCVDVKHQTYQLQ